MFLKTINASLHIYSVNKRCFDETWMKRDVLIDQNVPIDGSPLGKEAR